MRELLFILLYFVILVSTSCKAQTIGTEIIDPVTKLPYKVDLKIDTLILSDNSNKVIKGRVLILISIDSLSNLNKYNIQAIDIKYSNHENVSYINSEPYDFDAVYPEQIQKLIPIIDEFIDNNIQINKVGKTNINDNYMKLIIRIK